MGNFRDYILTILVGFVVISFCTLLYLVVFRQFVNNFILWNFELDLFWFVT